MKVAPVNGPGAADEHSRDRLLDYFGLDTHRVGTGDERARASAVDHPAAYAVVVGEVGEVGRVDRAIGDRGGVGTVGVLVDPLHQIGERPRLLLPAAKDRDRAEQR